MIRHDQPTIFGDTIVVAVSSIDDGPMNFRGNNAEDIKANRLSFLEQVGVDPMQTTLLQVTFEDTTDFARYKIVEDEHAGEGMLAPMSDTEADALIATHPEQAIFLPLADCVGAVIFDPSNKILMVSHLGRHSIEVEGARRGIEFLHQEFDIVPGELLVWLSPAVGKESYPLHRLGNLGLHEAIIKQLTEAGVEAGNIEASHVDTAESPDYFSHSDYLAGNRPSDDRFAVIAMMIEQ
jgi:copper oxidase (laccase) domain-containing protein